MRIGIDVSPLTANRTGVGNYCYYLLKHLLDLGKAHVFQGFASGWAPIGLGDLPGDFPVCRVPVPTRLLYKSWEWFGMPAMERFLGPVEVYHATNYFLPPVRRARRVVTIHDLAFLAVPDLCSPSIVGPFARGIGRFAMGADAILAYSESTKEDIMKYLDVSPERVTVAPMAVDEAFQPMEREKAEQLVWTRFGIKPPFLLFVSTLEPRKNVVGLIEAFKRLVSDIPHTLVLVGSVGWNAEPILEAMAHPAVKERIVRLGFVKHLELPAFYCAADAFVFPTHYEGFGLPLLEALTCGCPVVTADNSSVPEVTGGAALLSGSHDSEAVADNVRRILQDQNLRESLIGRGKEHAAGFSWRMCAARTLNVYEKLLD